MTQTGIFALERIVDYFTKKNLPVVEHMSSISYILAASMLQIDSLASCQPVPAQFSYHFPSETLPIPQRVGISWK